METDKAQSDDFAGHHGSGITAGWPVYIDKQRGA